MSCCGTKLRAFLHICCIIIIVFIVLRKFFQIMNFRNQIDEFSPIFKRRPPTNRAVYKRKSSEFLKEQNCRERWRKRWSDFKEMTSPNAIVAQVDEENEINTEIENRRGKQPNSGECSVAAARQFKKCKVAEFKVKRKIASSFENADIGVFQSSEVSPSPSPSTSNDYRSSHAQQGPDDFLQISIFPSRQSQISIASLDNTMIENLNVAATEKIDFPSIGDDATHHFQKTQLSPMNPSSPPEPFDPTEDILYRRPDTSTIVKVTLTPWNKLKLCKNGSTENLLKFHQRRSSDLSIWKRRRINQTCGDRNENDDCVKAEILSFREEINLKLFICRKISGTSSPASDEKIHVLINSDDFKREKNIFGRTLVLYPPHRILVRKNLPFNVYVAWKFDIN